ncbi:ThiF family adenylyltransferase [Microbispora hainanensis]|uniref:HesA/MoeB/ThiF family protein n=1 Tax=Microbispora hainanensis TaxID=568844 RepID=UPI002E2B6882|nr:ThiF family adenylyltransferase [Microbispora hainanensis]
MKFEHRPHRYEDGTIRIGGEIYGIAAEIADPDGWVWTALTLMDGTRSREEIAERLRLAHPELPDATSIVEELTATRYVEDAAAVPPAGLSERELDRYSRNHAFFRAVDAVPRAHGWEAQVRLKAARVVVLGLGGTGCHAAWALAAVGVGTIHCVDPDLVELSNLNRQVLYGEADVGRPKAEAAVDRLRSVNSDITVTGERRSIGSRRELDELITGYDALALCADRPTGHSLRVWANRACAAANIPWAGGGYSGPLVTVGCFAPREGTCYECLSSGEEARRRPGTPVNLGGPGVIATSAGVSGQLVAHALLGLLTGVPVPPVGTIQGLNLIAADHHVWVRHPPRPGCPVCGTRAPARNSPRGMTEKDAGRINRQRS